MPWCFFFFFFLKANTWVTSGGRSRTVTGSEVVVVWSWTVLTQVTWTLTSEPCWAPSNCHWHSPSVTWPNCCSADWLVAWPSDRREGGGENRYIFKQTTKILLTTTVSYMCSYIQFCWHYKTPPAHINKTNKTNKQTNKTTTTTTKVTTTKQQSQQNNNKQTKLKLKQKAHTHTRTQNKKPSKKK